MPRTRKQVSPLNLFKYDVLIEDTSVRSDYFKLSQFDGYFYGGRNGFLIAGASVLQPNSNILIEILDVNKNVVFSTPVKNYVEGNSRLIQIDVYNDTPVGAGKLVILGCANSYINGTPIPSEWKNKYNIRWSTDVIISPRIDNITPIRFKSSPKVFVEEKFYLPPATASIVTQSLHADFNLLPLNFNVFQTGYIIQLKEPNQFTSDMEGAVLRGEVSISRSDIPTPLQFNYTDINNDPLVVTKLINAKTGIINGKLMTLNDADHTVISSGFFSSSFNQAITTIQPLGNVTASGNTRLEYGILTQSVQNRSPVSFAQLRLTDLDTLSGKIHKIRVSYKATTEPGDYIVLGDLPVQVGELLAVDVNQQLINPGKFNTITSSIYWYTDKLNITRNDLNLSLPNSYFTSSFASASVFKTKNTILINGLDATPTLTPTGTYLSASAYFIGTKENNSVQLYHGTEYTLSFNSIVSMTSGSITLQQNDPVVEIYLIESSGSYTNSSGKKSTSKLYNTDIRGQLIGTLSSNKNIQRQNFERVQFNFTPLIKQLNSPGNYGLRFIVYGGFWEFADVSVKVAEELYFTPNEANFLIENVDFTTRLVTYKTEYLDVNSNSTKIVSFATPTYFTGSTLS